MDKAQFQKLLRQTFGVPFAIAVILAATLLLEVRFLMNRTAWVEHTDQVITLSQRIYRNRIDQETGLRAYLLTNDTRFLRPFYEGGKHALALEPELRRLVSDDAEQTARNEKSFQAVRAWSSWADQAIAMTEAGEDAGEVKFQLQGKELMDRYREARTQFLEREQQLRDERLARSRRSLELVNGSIVVLCILFGIGFAALGQKQLKSLSESFNEALTAAETNAVLAQAQKERLGGIIGSAMDAIISVDESQRIHVFNRAAEQIFRCPASDAVGQPLEKFIPERFRQAHRNHIDGFGRTGVTNRSMSRPGALWGLRGDGEEFPIEATISQVEAEGQKMFTVILRDITERKEAETKLTEQAGLLELASNAILVLDELDRVSYWNRGAEDLYGWTREEAAGKVIHDLLKTEFPQPLSDIVDRVRQDKHWEGELVHTCKNGVQVTVLSRWALVGNGEHSGGPQAVMEINTDITELKRAEEAVQAQKEWLHTTLTSIGDAVIATDADGIITLMNPVAERLTEWTSEEAKGKPLTQVFQILNQETHETVENPVDKVRRLNRVVGLANHTILISKSGQEIAIDDSGAPILDTNGAIAGIVLIFRDVTRQRALEAALQANERLALAGRLSASITHEIHNPLDTVGNVLFLLGEQVKNRSDIQRLITTAEAEVQRVTEISKNMLSLHRESRAPSVVKVSELLEGVVSLIEETIAKGRRNIRLEHGFEGEIEGFPSELRQVFTNVIKNAVEATANGGEIKISSEPAQESARGGVVVHVTDDGVGISDEMQSKLFTPFATTKEESGTGLGLWVSRSIVEKHGGTIRVSSGASRPGTTVSIFLPLEATPRRKVANTA